MHASFKVYNDRPAPVPREVGLHEGEASWKPLAIGTSLFSYGYSVEDRDTISILKAL